MFDDIRRVGEKVDDLLGINIFPFDYPFNHNENFLQHLEKWEFAIPMRFLWYVTLDNIPYGVNSQTMWDIEPGDAGSHSGANGQPGTANRGWDIDQAKHEITKETYMRSGGGKYGCMIAQGVVLPGETYDVQDIAINNNMGFLPGKVGGNRQPLPPLVTQWRETNRSLPDMVFRPWIILAAHQGLVATPGAFYDDRHNIKTNITVVQLAKTFQHLPHIERKIWRFYNCVPTTIDSKELTHQDGSNVMGQIFTVNWAYTHYTIESLPDEDMSAYMNKKGFQKFVKTMADKLLSRSKFYRKLKKGIAKVERFVDKANRIKKKVKGVLGFFGVGNQSGKAARTPPTRGGVTSGRALGSFRSDHTRSGVSDIADAQRAELAARGDVGGSQSASGSSTGNL